MVVDKVDLSETQNQKNKKINNALTVMDNVCMFWEVFVFVMPKVTSKSNLLL
jgi:hypothetical protein